MHSADADWPGPTEAIYASDLKRFAFTPRVNILFCGTCGTPMFYEGRYDGPDGPVTTGVFTGTLANIPHGNLIRVTDHIFVGDTVDGGASVWLRRPNADGRPARRWQAGKGTSAQLPYDWPTTSPPPSSAPPQGPLEMPIWCKCRGIDLVLRLDRSSFPDSEPLPFFVDPESKKLLAGCDPCDSCRLASGIDIFNWTFASLEHIGFASSAGGPVAGSGKFPRTATELIDAVSKRDDRDPRLGTLTFYESSPGVQQYFCERCSATAFYACEDRQSLVDVAVGLLEGPSGAARAEEALSWALGGKMGHRADVMGGWRQGLVESVEKGGENWRVEKGLGVNWRRKAREEAEKGKTG
jgi:hypothetical protein